MQPGTRHTLSSHRLQTPLGGTGEKSGCVPVRRRGDQRQQVERRQQNGSAGGGPGVAHHQAPGKHGHLTCPGAASVSPVEAARGWEPAHPAVASCAPLTLNHRLSFQLRFMGSAPHPEPGRRAQCPSSQRGQGLSTDPALHGPPLPGGARAGATPGLAAPHLAGEPATASTRGPGPRASLSPPALGPKPQTPKCFTLFAAGSPADLARQRLEGPGNSASAAQRRGPTLQVTAVAVTRRPAGSRERKARSPSSG